MPFEECASEQEIRERKPRILITNANQLELLLTRQQDFELFTGAPLSFIVLDEAHTYSGATGAEVACLVRRLRAFAGKAADEVTCIATSATIVDPERGAEVAPEFLARLCGVPQENVELVTERYEPISTGQARGRSPLSRPTPTRCSPLCSLRSEPQSRRMRVTLQTRRPASTARRSRTRSRR